MPSLADHQSNEFTKMLIMGDPGSGKTGALASLVCAGYKLRIADFDNGLEVLKQFVLKDCPSKIGNVEYRTFRDKRKATSLGPTLDGSPRAFIDFIKMLDHWRYDDLDLGKPAEWGPDTIFVVDSLTMLSDSCFDWRVPLTPKGKSGDYDKRATYFDSQNAIEEILKITTSEWFRTNLIVLAHVKYMEQTDGLKGYPITVGSALSPQVPMYFNTVALCKTQPGGKRTIQTVATSMIDLKNPKPFEMAPSYPIETGLADFFKVLRAQPKPALRKV